MSHNLTKDERKQLLEIARQALEQGVLGKELPALDLNSLPEALRNPGASFVTLTRHGELRGCVGALQAYQPLAEDVREHAVAAALKDYRFPPVSPAEVDQLEIEISFLTPPRVLEYERPDELPGLLRQGIDGVTIFHGWQRATFLPQVWEKLPNPGDFLDHLCAKMGADPGLWRRLKLKVEIYQVEEFHEGRPRD